MYFNTNTGVCTKCKLAERTNRGVLIQCKNAERGNGCEFFLFFFVGMWFTVKFIWGGIVYLK